MNKELWRIFLSLGSGAIILTLGLLGYFLSDDYYHNIPFNGPGETFAWIYFLLIYSPIGIIITIFSTLGFIITIFKVWKILKKDKKSINFSTWIFVFIFFIFLISYIFYLYLWIQNILI